MRSMLPRSAGVAARQTLLSGGGSVKKLTGISSSSLSSMRRFADAATSTVGTLSACRSSFMRLFFLAERVVDVDTDHCVSGTGGANLFAFRVPGESAPRASR